VTTALASLAVAQGLMDIGLYLEKRFAAWRGYNP